MKIVKKLALGSSLRVISLAANLAVGIILMPFILHTLGDRIYGYWILAASLIGYYGFFDIGIVSAVQYHVARAIGENDSESSNEIMSTALFTFFIIGILLLSITCLITYFSGNFISNQYEAALLKYVILIIGASFSIGIPFRIFMGAISAYLRFDLLSIINMSGLFVRTLMIVIVLKSGFGVIGLAMVTGITDLLVYVSYLLFIKKIHQNFNLSFNKVKYSNFKKILNYSIYNFIFKICRQIRLYIQPLIIVSFLSIESVTIFAIASKLSTYFLSIIRSSIGFIDPLFSQLKSQKNIERIKQIFLVSSKISTIMGTFIALYLILYGKQFIYMWVGKEYHESYFVLIVLIIGMLFDVIQFPSISYLMGIAKHKFLAYLALTELFLNVLISIIFIHIYGLIGVALGMAIPLVILKVFIQPFYICRQIGISPRFYYTKIIGVGFVINSLAIVIPWLIFFSKFETDNFISLFFLIVLQTIIALMIVYLFVFDSYEKSVINQLFYQNEKINRIVKIIFGGYSKNIKK